MIEISARFHLSRAARLLTRFALLISILPGASVAAPHPYELFEAGKIDEARTAFLDDLNRAQQSGNQRLVWTALMSLGWFEDELSNHRRAIEHSNRALEVASAIDDPFMLGRSLCWLGWAYAGLGMYDLALQFYDNALEIGAPGGKIVHVPVWGLALQEKGAILAKKGDLAGGRSLLEKSYGYALEHGVDIGVSEGGAHLAEIALQQGALDEAERFAAAAVEAARRCSCSVYNRLRAETVLLQVLHLRATADPTRAAELPERSEKLREECERLRQKRCIAEVKLIQSRMLPKQSFDERYQRVLAAFEILADAEHELRGAAEAELGRVFLDANKRELAALYLKNGLQLEESMFRKVSVAHISSDIAALAALEGDAQTKLRALLHAADEAERAGALPLLLDTERELVRTYRALGFTTQAATTAAHAVETAEMLEQKTAGPERELLARTKLELLELAVELAANQTPPTPDPPH